MGKDSFFANRRLMIGTALILSVMSVSFIQWTRLVPTDPFRILCVVLVTGFAAWFAHSLWSRGSVFLLDFCHYVVEVFGAIGIVVLGFALGVDRLINDLAGSLTPKKIIIIGVAAAIGIPLFCLVRWFGRQVFGDD